MQIVTVCTANLCRSPFAERVLQRMLAERAPNIVVTSTGLEVEPGRPVPAPWAAVATEFDIDLSDHRSRTPEDVLEGADLVLAMTADHLRGLVMQWPELVGRATTLGAAAGAAPGELGIPPRAIDVMVTRNDADVDDPMGRSRRRQRAVAARIVEWCWEIAQGLPRP